MQFKQFLLTENKTSVTNEISKKTAIKTISKNCSDFIDLYKKHDYGIYKGFKKQFNFMYGDSTTQNRKSKNTRNYYTLTMDNSSAWEQYPKRSKSFICSSNKFFASAYGYLYAVFPKNGTTIAVCPDSDLWGSFKKQHIYNLRREFVEAIYDFGSTFEINIRDDNIENFKKDLNELDNKINSKFDSNFELTKYLNSKLNSDYNEVKDLIVVKSKISLYDRLSSLLKPIGFELTTTSNYKINSIREVWFSGPAVFVNINLNGVGVDDSIYNFMLNFK